MSAVPLRCAPFARRQLGTPTPPTLKQMLSKIFARALQLHPRKAGLWVHAGAFPLQS